MIQSISQHILSVLFFNFMCCYCSVFEYETQIFLSIFYESKNNESKMFILEELEPVMETLHKHITVHLVPFGRAKSIKHGLNGFECHNGDSECLGNMIQDCTIHNMYKKTDLEKVKYIACEMEYGTSLRGDPYCIIKSGVNKEEVLKCITSSEGTQLQLSSEYVTNIVKPNHIPAIGINQVYNTTIDSEARSDLMGTLCSYIRNTHPCAKYYNEIALQEILQNDIL